MSGLCKMAELVDGGEPKMGVKTKPWWQFIPLTNFIIPLLHVLIGVGNDVLDSFRDCVNDEVECPHQCNSTEEKEETYQCSAVKEGGEEGGKGEGAAECPSFL